MKTVKGIAGLLLAMELLYLVTAGIWLLGGHGLDQAGAVGPLLLILAAAGTGITAPMLRGAHGAGTKWAAVAMAGVSLLAALVIVGDARLLTVLGYLPLLLLIAIGAAPGALPNAEQIAIADLAHQLLLFLLAGTWTVLALRLSHQPPAAAGRTAGAHPTTAGGFSRFFLEHRVAITMVAAAVPAVYAVTRFAWAAGIPLGITAENAGQLFAGGGATAALGLASVAAGGVLLTLGLVQRWGRQWPRWIPGIGGKPIPVGLAVVPAGLVAMILVPAGTDMFRLALAAPEDNGIPPFSWDNWGILGPNLLWHGWAVALAAAAYGYWLMRRDDSSDKETEQANVTDRTN